jgi:RecA-family ATPase
VSAVPVTNQAPAPQNLAAEEIVLGAILTAGADATSAATVAAIRATGLVAEHFYRASHGLIYAAALALVDRGEPADVVTLEHELRETERLEEVGGEQRVKELAGLVPATANAPHHARLVVEEAERRRVHRFAQQLQAAAVNGSLDADAALREAVRLLEVCSGAGSSSPAPWLLERWPQFRDRTSDEHRWLVEGVLPTGMLTFVAGPPKKGKTWLGLALGLAVATGQPLFGVYSVPEPRNVLYVALEGSRVGLRTRVGALARGLALDPDGGDLDRLTMLYRPRPFDLADLVTATWLRDQAEEIDAALVVVDVLRAAARFQENVAEDFARVRDALDPLLAAGRSVPVLHHFGKLSETQKERSPGERMAGTGAMYGALDVGFLITRSEKGAALARRGRGA